MDLFDVLDQVRELLQRRGRVTYRMLQAQFKLDAESLEALKEVLQGTLQGKLGYDREQPMPRGPRLDAPRVLHHVMARGIERQRIFQADADREDFVQRVAGLVDTAALTVYAWALLPNHFHLLVRTGRRPLARSMRSLLTGYAGAFNRRYRRQGRLFQNRYKSVVLAGQTHFKCWKNRGVAPGRGWTSRPVCA